MHITIIQNTKQKHFNHIVCGNHEAIINTIRQLFKAIFGTRQTNVNDYGRRMCGEEKGDLNRINCDEHFDLQTCEATKDLSVKSVWENAIKYALHKI